MEKAVHVYTVSEITQDIKLLLENTFTQVHVEGEVSNFRPHASGHLYFSLKDKNALLPAVMFVRAARDIRFKLEDGLQVVCSGRIEVYPPHGKYQLILESIEPQGIGSLQLALEQLKEKLEKEGLFKAEHKRPIPYLPRRIGIVTSLSGAAIRDMLKVLDRRFADVHVIIRPALVQGDGAREDIAEAIREMNLFNESCGPQEKIEVMIVGRGGGSIEDLWAFNEEVVARAIYHSKIPVVSAVGHERDWTVADLVADMRAPTPSVAAELVMPKKEDLQEELDRLGESLAGALLEGVGAWCQTVGDLDHRLGLAMENAFRLYASELSGAGKKLALMNPAARIDDYINKLGDVARQMYVRAQHFLRLRQAGLATAAAKLSNLSPLLILGRGYSITFTLPGQMIVRDAAELSVGDRLHTRLHKGFIVSTVTEVNKNGRS